MIDLEAIRLQYELYRMPLDELAEINSVDIQVLEYAREEQNWQVAPIKDIMVREDIGELAELNDNVIDALKDRNNMVRSLKDTALYPKYMVLETMLLNKAQEIIKGIDPQAPQAADILKKVSDIFDNLKDRIEPKATEDSKNNSDDKLVVQILNVADSATPLSGARAVSAQPSAIEYDA
jgi:hypothetical protein